MLEHHVSAKITPRLASEGVSVTAALFLTGKAWSGLLISMPSATKPLGKSSVALLR